MFFTKLKAIWAVALALVLGAGVVGLTYHQAAAQSGPAPERPQAPPKAARVADELEELRLEVAALRKGLEATRARVKSLEEAQAQRPKGEVPPTGTMGGGDPRKAAAEREYQKIYSYWLYVQSKKGSDPLATLEAAVKKLRQNPGDKQALEALDRALKRLRERPKPQATPTVGR